MKSYKYIIITTITALFVGLIAGALIFGGKTKPSTTQTDEHMHDENQIWTCSMHPQIRNNEPGKCPICGMFLVPIEEDESTMDANAITMSERAMQLADIQTTVIGVNTVENQLRLTGKVQEDERLVYNQTAHFPGRIEKLYVNFTGEYIKKGQKIASVYSPNLISAQEELFEAKKFGNTALVESARKKLTFWKLSEEEIKTIETSGKVMSEVPVRADVTGVVLSKNINLGSHVMEGSTMFKVADLSKVWVVFDAYESDLPWIKINDEIKFSLASLAGETFTARVTFIDPVIDPKTRVALVRTEVDNKKGLLKPEMLTTGILKTDDGIDTSKITVPKSAVMWTGKRSVVYVKLNTDKSEFVIRDVILGAALGDSYIITSGLKADDEVVTNGTFTIDAAAQLQGKKSMMNPDGGEQKMEHVH